MMQLDMFPTRIRLQCIDAAHNKRRFYIMAVQPTLFGEWQLMREWGRIGRAGRVRHDVFTDAGRAHDALAVLAKQKKKRGYS